MKFGYEEYLNDIKKQPDRIALTRLRISNHCLEIETGRHQKPPIPRDARFVNSAKNTKILIQ